MFDVSLHGGKPADFALPEGHTTALLVISGEVLINGERAAGEGDLAIFDRMGKSITVKANTDSALLVMDGQLIKEPIVGSGPFVMNSREEIAQAFKDFQSGRMGKIPV